jgi:Transposase DDE domain
LFERVSKDIPEKSGNIFTNGCALKFYIFIIFSNHKGNATAVEHVEIINRFVEEFGVERIQRVYGYREFSSYQLIAYLIKNRIDFHIRLKTSHKTAGKSFLQMWKNVSERVKLRGKVKIKVFGLEIYVSCVKLNKSGKTEYLIVARKAENKYALEEYKVRWQIETMFGCLKIKRIQF